MPQRLFEIETMEKLQIPAIRGRNFSDFALRITKKTPKQVGLVGPTLNTNNIRQTRSGSEVGFAGFGVGLVGPGGFKPTSSESDPLSTVD